MAPAFIKGIAFVCLVVAVSGCRDNEFPTAPVSGVVTLDGQPLSGARIQFQPLRTGEEENAGPGSFAMTDELGHFQQETIRGDDGAVIGMHKVRIRTRNEEVNSKGRVQVVRQEEVPAKYNIRTELFFTVPNEGTDSANFDLTTKK